MPPTLVWEWFCPSVRNPLENTNKLPETLYNWQSHVGYRIQVIQAQGEEPYHPTPPNGKLYVPSSLRSDVITWAHSSRIACHGGVSETLNLLRRRFFWPSMNKDIREYVAACSTRARSKSSNSPPSGLLHPLPTPTNLGLNLG